MVSKTLLKSFKLMLLLVIIQAYDSYCFDPSGANGSNDWWPIKSTSSPKTPECGVGITPLFTEMNGTRDANEGEIVWQVSVQKKTNGKWAHSCGGVVINKNFVLTSAQCVDGLSEAFIRSEAGTVDLPKGGWVRRKRQSSFIPDISYPGQQLPGLQYTQKITVHPEYDKTTLENNLALVSLAQPFDESKAEGKINSICLSENDINLEQLFVSGWGAITNENELNLKLQVIKAKIIECDSKESIENQLCVKEDIVSSHDINDCQGDLGGPLFSYNGSNSTLIGIYSSGKGCSDENPAKFIEISKYLKWIEENSIPIYSQNQ